MASKRVAGFFDMFDSIPEKAVYLFSRKVEVPLEETTEQKNARIISNNPEAHFLHPAIVYIHYYEVDEYDFEELMKSDFAQTNNVEKIKNFMEFYKIPVK